MIEHVLEVAEAVEQERCMFGTVDTWLLYKLTGRVSGCTNIFFRAISTLSST